MAFTDAGLRHAPHQPKVSNTWGVCGNGHFQKGLPNEPEVHGILRKRESWGQCECGGDVQPLRLEQRRLLWADEAAIIRDAVTPRGAIDPQRAIQVILDRTTKAANFKLDVEQVEADLGWYLYKWLEIPTAIGSILTGGGDGKK